MSILVLGCGRTGTNMILESLRASDLLRATNPAEHRTIFRAPLRLPSNYLSKCDTCYIDNLSQVDRLLDGNPELFIIWTIRDLRDCSMSKIYRGQPGHDAGSLLADDASYEGCLADIRWMSKIYQHIVEKYPSRIKLVKMEDVVLNYEKTMTNICNFCGIDYIAEMKNFTSRYRGSVKRTKGARYNGIDKGQVNLYKRRQDVYGGFFINHNIDLDKLFAALDNELVLFGYRQEEATQPYNNKER